MSLSPDGSKVAAAVGEPNGRFDVRVYDLTRGEKHASPLDGPSCNPIWTADGRMITYLSGTVGQIVNKPSNGLGEPAVVASTTDRVAPTSWPPDGRRLLYMNFSGGKGPRTWCMKLDRMIIPC
jgi:Tol biopolymer transport system component